MKSLLQESCERAKKNEKTGKSRTKALKQITLGMAHFKMPTDSKYLHQVIGSVICYIFKAVQIRFFVN